MLSFNQYLTEKKKEKIHFNPDDVSQSGTVTEDSQLDEFSLNPVKIVKRVIDHNKTNSTYERLAKRIDNDKNHNFISRAIAHNRLKDRMEKRTSAINKKYS